MGVYALIVGLGGTGGRVLVRLKSRLADLPPEVRDRFRLLAIDTDTGDLDTLEHLGHSLDKGEKLFISADVRSLRRHSARHAYLQRFPLDRLPAIALNRGARQCRPLGALAYAWNFENIRERLSEILWGLRDRERQAELANFRLTVAVVTSLAGGTGSGMFIDLAYLIRQLLREIGVDQDAELFLIAVGPNAFHDVHGPKILPNTMRALMELHFWMDRGRFSQKYRGSGGPNQVEVDDSPFDLVFYVDAIDEVGWAWRNREALAAMLAEALLVLTAYPIGQTIRSFAENVLDRIAHRTRDGELTFLSSLGVASIEFPIRQVFEVLAARRGAELLGLLLRGPDGGIREEAERWVSERPWSPERFQSDLCRRAGEGTPLMVGDLAEDWLFDVDPEAMPEEARRHIERHRQLRIDAEFADHIRRQASAWLEQAARDLEEAISRMVETSGLPAALRFVQLLQQRAQDLEKELDERRERVEVQEQAAQGSLEQIPQPPWHIRLLARIPRLGSWLKKRWARQVTRRLLEAGERFLNARLERIALEEARASVGRLADLLTDRQAELQGLERAVQGAIALLEKEREELGRKVLAEDKPSQLRLIDRNRLDTWAGRSPPTSRFGLPALRELRTAENLAADAKRRSRSGLEFLWGITVEDLMNRPDGISPQERLGRLKELARPAWRLEEAACPDQPPLIQVIGVRDATHTLFSGEGNRLVSTGDPYRVSVVAMRIGAPISGLLSYESMRRAYESLSDPERELLSVFWEVKDGGAGGS